MTLPAADLALAPLAAAGLRNRDVFERDPTSNTLQNDGVSKVSNAEALRYELATFVCDGSYAAGLDRILASYLSHLDQSTQPSAWVSGFYGSGKSHLVKVHQALWDNHPLADGQLPRDLARLPDEIKQQLRELSNEAKRAGGLWSAAGMLSESGNQSVRMLLLGIVYKAAGLSSNYGRARFRLWLRRNGWEEEVTRAITAAGLDPEAEYGDYLVSSVIGNAVWELSKRQSGDPFTMQDGWDAAFNRQDISIDEMEESLKDVLKLQSATGRDLPLTLLVLDEVQQYLGESGERTQALQEAVERIQSAFESRVLVVATGQAALSSTPNLQKLQGRFSVNVMLSDKDVEQVVREVVLRKNATHRGAVEATVKAVEGEIDRQLQATKLGPRSDDKAVLADDYPLLPARGRFWSHVLHQIDPTGTSGQLRTQLRVVHSATVQVADLPLGHVIPGDFIYDQLHGGLQQSGVLTRDVANLIADQGDDTGDGRLRARLIQLIFLIERLPAGDLNDAGLRATPENLADLLIEDLTSGGDELRRRIPDLLRTLEDDGKLMRQSDGGYAIQTGESLKWNAQFQQERQALLGSPGPLGERRQQILRAELDEQTKSIRKQHGVTKTKRDLGIIYGNEAPAANEDRVMLWVRDGWGSAEKTVIDDARQAGDDSPTIALFIPQRSHQDLQQALASYEAAKRTLEIRGASQDTSEGQQAADGMRNRMQENERRVTVILREAVAQARVLQGGGSEVEGTTVSDKLQRAFEVSLKRRFPQFGVGDVEGWDKVWTHATQQNPAPMKAIGHPVDESAHPVIKAVLAQVPGGQGVTWAALRKTFGGPPWGWGQDTIDGAVAVLMSTGLVNVVRDQKPVRGKDLAKPQASSTYLSAESQPLTVGEKLAVRKLFVDVTGQQPDDETARTQAPALVEQLVALARAAGGEPPLPLPRVPAALTELQGQIGNQLLKSLALQRETLAADVVRWREQAALAEQRREPWRQTTELAGLAAAGNLPGGAAITAELDQIRDERRLLDPVDPLPPITARLADEVRTALRERLTAYNDALDAGLTALKATNEWLRLTPEQQAMVLARPDLARLPEPALSSAADLVTALRLRSFDQLAALADALPHRLDLAQGEVVRLVQPAVITVAVEKPLLEKPADVEQWLARLKESVLDVLEAGNPVKIV